MIFRETYSWTVVRLPAFVIGMMIAMEKITLSKKNLIIGCVFVFLALGYKALHFVGMIPTRGLFQYVLFSLGITSFCYGLIYIKSIFDYFHLTKFLKWIGNCSLEIFLCHVFIFDCISLSSWYSCSKLVIAITISLLLAYFYNKVVGKLHLMEKFAK